MRPPVHGGRPDSGRLELRNGLRPMLFEDEDLEAGATGTGAAVGGGTKKVTSVLLRTYI